MSPRCFRCILKFRERERERERGTKENHPPNNRRYDTKQSKLKNIKKKKKAAKATQKRTSTELKRKRN